MRSVLHLLALFLITCLAACALEEERSNQAPTQETEWLENFLTGDSHSGRVQFKALSPCVAEGHVFPDPSDPVLPIKYVIDFSTLDPTSVEIDYWGRSPTLTEELMREVGTGPYYFVRAETTNRRPTITSAILIDDVMKESPRPLFAGFPAPTIGPRDRDRLLTMGYSADDVLARFTVATEEPESEDGSFEVWISLPRGLEAEKQQANRAAEAIRRVTRDCGGKPSTF